MLKRYILAGIFALMLDAAAVSADPYAYVINTSGETLSKINLTTGVVTNNILTLGTDIHCYPNQIVIRDTLAYVVLSGTDEIQIINLKTENTVGWIDLPQGSNPYWMAFFDERHFYVTLMKNNSLAKVDAVAKQVLFERPIGLSPEGVVLFDDKAFVAITGFDFGTFSWGQGQAAIYDLLGDTLITAMNVGKNPQFLDHDRLGRIHIVCTGDYWQISGKVYLIDSEQYSIIDSLPIGGQPGQIAIAANDTAYLAAGGWINDGEVYSYDAVGLQMYHDWQNPIYVDSGAGGVVRFQDTTVFVTCFGDKLVRLDADGSKIAAYIMGDGPVAVDFDYRPGDANGDWQVNVGDAVYLINYIFKSGLAPAIPRWRANPNGDASINVGDCVYLITHIFKSGSPPKFGPGWVR